VLHARGAVPFDARHTWRCSAARHDQACRIGGLEVDRREQMDQLGSAPLRIGSRPFASNDLPSQLFSLQLDQRR
jgi:hypothetical protein